MNHIAFVTLLLGVMASYGCEQRAGGAKPAHSCTVCLSAAGIGSTLTGRLSGKACATEGGASLEGARQAAQARACDTIEKNLAEQWHTREGITYENSFTQATVNLCDDSGAITSKKTSVTSVSCK